MATPIASLPFRDSLNERQQRSYRETCVGNKLYRVSWTDPATGTVWYLSRLRIADLINPGSFMWVTRWLTGDRFVPADHAERCLRDFGLNNSQMMRSCCPPPPGWMARFESRRERARQLKQVKHLQDIRRKRAQMGPLLRQEFARVIRETRRTAALAALAARAEESLRQEAEELLRQLDHDWQSARDRDLALAMGLVSMPNGVVADPVLAVAESEPSLSLVPARRRIDRGIHGSVKL